MSDPVCTDWIGSWPSAGGWHPVLVLAHPQGGARCLELRLPLCPLIALILSGVGQDGLPGFVLLCWGTPTASQGDPRSFSALAILAIPTCHLLWATLLTGRSGDHQPPGPPVFLAADGKQHIMLVITQSEHPGPSSSPTSPAQLGRDPELPLSNSRVHLWPKGDGERSSLSPLYQQQWHIVGNWCLSTARWQETHELFISSISWHGQRVVRAVK